MDTPVDICRPLAPEDLCVDDYVTVTRQTYELLSFSCDDAWRPPRLHRVTATPPSAGQPLRVVRLCLPFVLVKDPRGKHATLDLRRHEVSRLSQDYGRKAFKCLEQNKGNADA